MAASRRRGGAGPLVSSKRQTAHATASSPCLQIKWLGLLCLSCGCWAASMGATMFATLSLLPRKLQPRDRLNVNANSLPLVGDGVQLQLIEPLEDTLRREDVEHLQRAGMMDVMGMYVRNDEIEEQPVFGGRPVFSKYSDSNTLLWYYEGPSYERQRYDGWYGGPKEHLGTVKAMMKSSAGRGHSPPRSGWHVSSLGESSEPFARSIEGLQVLRHDEVLAELERGARLLKLWDASDRPKLTLGTRVPHSMSPHGIFEHDGSLGYDDGRPVYAMNGPFMMHTFKVTLWWSMAMECWCVGLHDPARPEWQTCELRTHDGALLPEWSTQPWYQLVDERALTTGKDDLCEMRQGSVYFQGTPVRYVEAKGVRPIQLPFRAGAFYASWAARKLSTLGWLLLVAFLGVNAWSLVQPRLRSVLAAWPPLVPPPVPLPVPPVPPPVPQAMPTKKAKHKPSAEGHRSKGGGSTPPAAEIERAQAEIERVRREAEAHAAAQLREIKRLQQRAAQQDAVYEEAKLCVICLDHERSCMLRPCKHMCVCDECAARIVSDSGECPMCRTRVENVERVYT